jgi:DNA-binding protein YbaB
MIHSGKWIFIRFNPDTNVSKIDIQDKLVKLIETIEDCIYTIEQDNNVELIKIIKLYC